MRCSAAPSSRAAAPSRRGTRSLAALSAVLLVAGGEAHAGAPEDEPVVLAADEGEVRETPATPESEGASAERVDPEARYLTARDHLSLNDGASSTAMAALDVIARDDAAPATVRRNSLHLMGRLALAAGDDAAAVSAFTRALDLGLSRAAPTALADEMRFGLAKALAATGRRDDAITELRRVEREELSPHREDALRLQARLTEEAGKAKQARKLYDRFLDRYPDSPAANEVIVRRAALDIALDDVDAAVRPLRELVRVAPDSRAGLEARLLLEGVGAAPGGGPVDLDEVEYLVSERRFDEARALLTRAVDEARAAKSKRRERQARELLLKAEYESFRFTEALAEHVWLEANGGEGLGDYHLSRLYAFTGDLARGEKVHLDRYDGKKGRLYWSRVADLRYEFGDYKGAYQAYYRARKRGRRGDPDPTERMIWCLLRMDAEDAAKAARWFGDKGGRARGETRAYYRYWYGRALQRAGDTDAARTVFEALAEDMPWDYYGIQAWSRVADIDGTVPPVISGERPTATVHWSEASLAGAFDQAPRRAPAPEIDAALKRLVDGFGEMAPEAVRAAELASLGLYDEANEELHVVGMDLRTLARGGSLSNRARADMLDNRRDKKARSGASIRERGRKSTKAARAFARNAGALRVALRDAQRALAEPYALRRAAYETGGFDDGPKSEAWRDAYPIAHPELVRAFSRQFHVPPYFVYAIMTVESAFHPHAISVSDAYGLLQMIPRTGRRVAAELGYSEFSPELLLRPPVNVYFGTYYVASALDKFQGQEPLAAAAYNAGPHRVAAWLLARGDSPMDMFIEEIPFGQARGYAKSVLKHLARYRAIYHDERHTYVSNTIARDFAAEPNY